LKAASWALAGECTGSRASADYLTSTRAQHDQPLIASAERWTRTGLLHEYERRLRRIEFVYPTGTAGARGYTGTNDAKMFGITGAAGELAG
jgi:hypothetical protein